MSTTPSVNEGTSSTTLVARWSMREDAFKADSDSNPIKTSIEAYSFVKGMDDSFRIEMKRKTKSEKLCMQADADMLRQAFKTPEKGTKATEILFEYESPAPAKVESESSQATKPDIETISATRSPAIKPESTSSVLKPTRTPLRRKSLRTTAVALDAKKPDLSSLEGATVKVTKRKRQEGKENNDPLESAGAPRRVKGRVSTKETTGETRIPRRKVC